MLNICDLASTQLSLSKRLSCVSGLFGLPCVCLCRSAGRPGTSCLPAATRPLMSNAARPLSAQFRTSNHQHIMQLPGQHHHLQQAEQHPVLLWDGAILQQDEPTQVQRPFSATTCVEAVPGAETSQPGADPLAALSITSAGVAGAVRPSLAPSR